MAEREIVAEYGMSKKAVEAYLAGFVPASKIKDIPPSLIKKFCTTEDVQRTSSYLNRTPFYDLYKVRAIFGLDPKRKHMANPLAVKALKAWRVLQPKEQERRVIDPCAVEWVEFRKPTEWPRAITHKVQDARVEIEGKMATVTLKNGISFRKRLSCKTFKYWIPGGPSEQLSLLTQR